MTVLKAGADAGNNALKLIVEGQEQDPIMIPSSYYLYYGETTGLLSEEELTKDQYVDNIDVTINSKALKLNGERYVIGSKVLRDNEDAIEMEEKSDKSTDDLPVLVTLSGLAVAAMKNAPKRKTIDVTYDLGVALPIATIKPEIAKRHAARFIGYHEVIFHHPNGREVTINIKVEFCKCQVEGGVGSWAIVYDSEGNKIEKNVEITRGNETFKDKITLEDKQLILFDVGAGTGEIAVTKGVAFQPKLSIGLHYGVKQTIHKIMGVWNNKYPERTIDTIVEFNDIFFDESHERHMQLKAESKTSLKGFASRLSKEIINKIDATKDKPYCFIFGGGADVIKDELKDILQKYANITFLPDPLFVNARGIYVYVKSPMFQKAKDKELGVTADAENTD